MWPPAVQGLLCLLLFVLLSVLGMGLQGRGLLADLQALQREAQPLRAELAGKTAEVALLAEQPLAAVATGPTDTPASLLVPEGSDVPTLLDDLAASGPTLAFTVLELQEAVLDDGQRAQPFTLRVSGSFQELLAFFRTLSRLPRLVTLQDFSLLAADAAPRLDLQVSGQAYLDPGVASAAGVARPAASPGAALQRPVADVSQPRSPFEPWPAADPTPAAQPHSPTPVRPRDYLEHFALDTLTLVGTLTRSGRVWALIRDESSRVSPVTVGSYVGLHQGRIRAIAATRVDLVERIARDDGVWIERLGSLGLAQP
jgi:Tfp pilus assembly protein PilP/Tfp pilus assembly protein PilO